MAQAAPQESKVFIEDKTCAVCCINPVNVIPTPCNHMICNMCVKRVDKCPTCRAKVVKTINITEAILKSDKHEVLKNQIEQFNNSNVQDVDTNLFDTIIGFVKKMIEESSSEQELRRSALIWMNVLRGATTIQLLKRPQIYSVEILLPKFTELLNEPTTFAMMRSLVNARIEQILTDVAVAIYHDSAQTMKKLHSKHGDGLINKAVTRLIIMKESINCLKVLLANGHADTEVILEGRATSLLILAIHENKERVIEVLLAWPNIDLDYRDENGCSALDEAIRNGHFELVQQLVTNGAELSYEEQHNPVHLALAHKQAKIAGYLMMHDATLADELYSMFEEESDSE